MSDVVWAAAIAAAVGISGNLTAVLVSKNASRQERVRRAEDRRDAERDMRRETYEKFAWQLARLHKYAVPGYPPTEEDWRDWLDYYAYWSGAVRILGGPHVLRAADLLTRSLDAIGEPLARAAVSGTWRECFQQCGSDVEHAREEVERAMRLEGGNLDESELSAASALKSPPRDGIGGSQVPELAPEAQWTSRSR